MYAEDEDNHGDQMLALLRCCVKKNKIKRVKQFRE